MSDYQQIPEAIRSVLAVDGAGAEEELADLAGNYATLCRDANDRLRRCADYLRRGMRSEAVHLATCQPDLFEMTTALQTAELPGWERLCATRGFTIAPRLLSAILPDLKEALPVERTLDPLLARHRVLSLAKATVVDRLRLVRAIAARDSANPCWLTEIRELETARIGEMRIETSAAFKSRDASAVELLNAELSACTWLCEIPKDLSDGLRKALDVIRMDRAMEQVNILLAALVSAHQSQSYEACSALMSQWQELIETQHLVLPDKIQRQIRPVAAWLSAEARRRDVNQKMQAIQPVLRDEAEQRRLAQRQLVFVVVSIVVILAAVAYLALQSMRR